MVLINGKEYTVRPLGFPDVFTVSRILNRLDLKVEEGNEQKMGTALLLHVVTHLGNAEQEVFDWIASLLNMPAPEVKTLKLDDVAKVVAEMGKQPEMAPFFSLFGVLTR